MGIRVVNRSAQVLIRHRMPAASIVHQACRHISPTRTAIRRLATNVGQSLPTIMQTTHWASRLKEATLQLHLEPPSHTHRPNNNNNNNNNNDQWTPTRHQANTHNQEASNPQQEPTRCPTQTTNQISIRIKRLRTNNNPYSLRVCSRGHRPLSRQRSHRVQIPSRETAQNAAEFSAFYIRESPS
jgi:hypothetical protein